MKNEIEILSINLKDFILIALETWRISKTVNENKEISQNVGLRYSLRKINKVLEINKVELIDLTGKKYDSGMAVDVIDSVEVESLEKLYVMETIEPIIMYDNQVVNRGKVILDVMN